MPVSNLYNERYRNEIFRLPCESGIRTGGLLPPESIRHQRETIYCVNTNMLTEHQGIILLIESDTGENNEYINPRYPVPTGYIL